MDNQNDLTNAPGDLDPSTGAAQPSQPTVAGDGTLPYLEEEEAPLELDAGAEGQRSARAHPLVLVDEEYNFQLEVAENPIYKAGNTKGRIEVRIPYDGDEGFTRQLYDEVHHKGISGDVRAGYLSIAEAPTSEQGAARSWRKTRENLEIPSDLDLRVSLPDYTFTDIARPTQKGVLIADRYLAVLNKEYSPVRPRVNPLDIGITIYDDDVSIEGVEQYVQTRTFSGNRKYGLQLQFSCGVALPTEQAEMIRPTVRLKSLGIRWPVVPDRNRIEVEIRNAKLEWRRGSWLYNAESGAVEVYDVPMTPQRLGKELSWTPYLADVRFHVSLPGDLYEVDTLPGSLNVEVMGFLLSRRQFELFNHNNVPYSADVIRYTTQIKGQFNLHIESCFRRRPTSTYWKMQFDGIELDEGRISDVAAALDSLGYEIRWQGPAPSDTTRHLIVCRRWEDREGNYTELQLLLERGHTRSIDWEDTVPGTEASMGGRRRISIPDDQLIVHIRGLTEGESCQLSSGIRQFQARLKRVFYSLSVAR